MDIATEKESMEVVDLLWEAIGEEIPEKVKLLQLSRAMYKEDREEAKKKFKELLRSFTPELVRQFPSQKNGRILRASPMRFGGRGVQKTSTFEFS